MNKILLYIITSVITIKAQISFNVKLKNIKYENVSNYFAKNKNVIKISPLCNEYFNSELNICNWFTITFKDSLKAVIFLDTSSVVTFYEVNRKRLLHKFYKTNNLPDNYHHYLIKTFDAWKVTSGDTSVIIGIIDTGIDYFHPELRKALAVNPAEDLNKNGTFEPWLWNEYKNGIPGDINNIDDDGNGYVDDVIGYDFTDQLYLLGGGDYLFEDPDPYDLNSHGTIVASIISANPNDGNNLYGIAPNCKIKILKTFSASGVGEDDDIAKAIIYAVKNNISVINMSFGDIYPSRMMREAIKYAYNNGIVLVASAGNGGGQNPHYPSGFPEVISVSASDINPETGYEFIWFFSSYGYNTDLCAPGNSVLATIPLDSAGNVHYGYYSGTSIAAPMVSASAALLKSINNNLSPENIKTILTSTTDDIMDKGWDIYTANGRLNIYNALKFPFGGIIKFHNTSFVNNFLQIIYSVVLPTFKYYSLEYKLNNQWFPIKQGNSQVIRDTAFLNLNNLPQGELLLRINITLQNDKQLNIYKNILWDTTKIKFQYINVVNAWDHNQKKLYVFGKANKKALHSLIINNKTYENYDKITKRFEFLFPGGKDTFNITLSSKNNITKTDSFIGKKHFPITFVPTTGLKKINKIKNGYFITPIDLNGDNTKEIIMSRFNENLQYSAIETYTLINGNFVRVDSFADFPVLIPRSIADYDNDGLLDLLTSVYDTIVILTQEKPNSYKWKLKTIFPENYYAVGFYDVNKNGKIELWCKDVSNYLYYEWNGQNFVFIDSLVEPTKDFISSTAPIFTVADADNDNLNEVFFKDYDGDLIIYEWNGNNFQLIQVIQDSLISGASKITSADIDNDNIPEIITITPSSYLRDELDYEYQSKYVKIQIIEAAKNDSFKVSFTDYIYNYNSLRFNSVSTANIDNDPESEIIIAVFPKLYIMDFNNQSYEMKFFDYGVITNSIISYDKNLIIGFGDSAFVYQIDSPYYYLQEPPYLQGKLLTNSSIKLWWQKVNNATSYEIWRTNIRDSILTLQGTTIDSFFIQNNLPQDTFIYVVRAISNTTKSKFSNPVFIRTGNFTTITKAKAITPTQMEVCFSSQLSNNSLIPVFFMIDSLYFPENAIPSGNNCVVLNFSDSLFLTSRELCIDSNFTDIYKSKVFPPCILVDSISIKLEELLYLTSWEKVSKNSCILRFNNCITSVGIENFSVSPWGSVVKVEKISDTSVKLYLEGVVIGATGIPVIIKVKNITGCNNEILREGYGDVAIFQENPTDLKDVYVYPNPIRKNKYYEGCYFAGVPQGSTITIYTETGIPIKKIYVSENTGGVHWNLTDQAGTLVLPGTYIYKVEYNDQKIINKLAILEQ